MASLVITVQGAGLALSLLGGTWSAMPFAELARPLVGRGDRLFPAEHRARRDRDRALDASSRSSSTWHNNFLWSAPSYFVGAGSAALAASLARACRLLGRPVHLRAALPDLPHLQGLHGADRGRAAARAADLGPAPGDHRSAGARDRRQGSDHADAHPPRPDLRGRPGEGRRAVAITEIQGVKTAALLHDIGKLAVPEHILSKPGPLTQEEFQKIRIHPQVGAEIIAAVPFPYPVAPMILQPSRAVGRQGLSAGAGRRARFPLGARILTIVDYFDAVTTERPYHKALTSESAIGLLQARSGARARPGAGAAVRRAAAGAARRQLDAEAKRRRCTPRRAATPLAGQSTGRRPRAERHANNAFENIALAHREIYALYEIAQSMGTSLGVADTMALISSKLTKIVPWSGCALFLHQPETDTLKCRFAAGIDAPQLLNATVKVGERARRAGWRATGGRWSTATRASRSKPAGTGPRIALKSAIVCPLHFNDTFIGCLALYHVEANRYTEDHRRLHRAHRRAGRRRDPQLDRVRADAGRLADRSADRPAEPPIDVRAPVARAGARGAPQERGRAHRHGHRRLQGDQRHLRAPHRRPRAARGGAWRSRARCVRTTSASATPATSSSSCSPTARARRPSSSGASCRSASAEIEIEVRDGQTPAAGGERRRGRCSRTTATTYEDAARGRRSPHVSRQGRAPRPVTVSHRGSRPGVHRRPTCSSTSAVGPGIAAPACPEKSPWT